MIPERTLGFLLVLALSIQQIVGPPAAIKNNHDDAKGKDHAIKTNEVEVEEMMQDPDFEVEYKRYLDEIVKTLETDEAFKKKVEASNVDDINSGKIAQELESVNHDVRSKLDELKRQEVQRLRDLIRKKEELGHGPIHPSEYEHIDHFNLETFEVKDLDNLIKKVSKDMEKINELRKEQFKQYELQKQFKEELKMANMTETEKEEYKKHLEQIKKKHANHEKIHHPGSKAQLEEVWEKQDHLENQEFDPKIFFHLHDIDSNGYWDQEEVKALFIKELDKMYQAGLPEDDMKERQEEMERMTEHVFKEMDKNGDSLISFQEYMAETKSKEFNQDEGWDTLDKQQIYSQQEYAEYERRRVAEIQSMIDQGMIPPPPYDSRGMHGNQHKLPEEYPGLHHMNQVHPNQPQYHPNQVPQYHPNQVPPQGYHPNQAPPHPNQVPPHHNQVPPHHNQVPPHPNQVPQHPNQVPQHPNQVPQHPNQVPQHPNQYHNQVPPHPSQQQYQQQQAYQQNQHPNQVPQQQYHPNPPYQPGSQTNQNTQQQYQNNQQQYQNNQQYQQQPNQNNQQQYQQQPNQNNQQPSQNNQQPNQNNQQPNQSNHQSNQYQPPSSQNNQQQQPNPNSQNQASQHSNPQPPAATH